jgi:hypothetical protein
VEYLNLSHQLAEKNAQLEAVEGKVKELREGLKRAQIELRVSLSDRDAALLKVAQLEERLSAITRKASTAASDPVKPAAGGGGTTAAPITAAGAAGTIPTDLIQFATAYADAVRDAKKGGWRVKYLNKFVSGEEQAMIRFDAEAAERKAELMRSLLTSALRSAETEFRALDELHAKGAVPTSHVSSARDRVDMLRLILDSGK